MEPLLIKALLWWLSVGLICAAYVTGGLKWVRVNVPRYRVPGEMAQLQCDYDLGNDTLYAVKWYKEYEEFYRYVPKARPQATSYNVIGVPVDMSISDDRKIVLKSVDLNSSGNYRCEVSAEAPSFASAQSEARMEVVSLPQSDPTITGMDLSHRIGDQIELNCTSGKSYPASLLHWYINEQLVKKEEALVKYEPIVHEDGLEQSVLGLRFILDERHFLGGSMRVKCVASLSPLIWKGENRQSTVQSLPIRDLREALLLVKSSATKIPTPGMTFVLIVLVAGTLGSLRSSAGAAGNRPGAHEGCVTRWKIK